MHRPASSSACSSLRWGQGRDAAWGGREDKISGDGEEEDEGWSGHDEDDERRGSGVDEDDLRGCREDEIQGDGKEKVEGRGGRGDGDEGQGDGKQEEEEGRGGRRARYGVRARGGAARRTKTSCGRCGAAARTRTSCGAAAGTKRTRCVKLNFPSAQNFIDLTPIFSRLRFASIAATRPLSRRSS